MHGRIRENRESISLLFGPLMKIFDTTNLPTGPLWLELFVVVWIFALPVAACYQCLGLVPAVAFSLLAVSPRLLWRPGQPPEGKSFVLANAIYWNMLYPMFFGSPLFIALFSWVWPRACGVAALVYFVGIKTVVRPDLKDGAGWQYFSQHDWGMHALRHYLRLRLHMPEKLLARPASEPVVIAIHPHGIASDFRVGLDGLLYAAMPGRHVLALAASVLFTLPFVRELCLWTRCIDASKPIASRALRKGHSLLVLPGGEAEQMRTRPGVEEVYLAKRVGFVKLAMQQKAALVPCYAFGVVDLYAVSDAQYKSNAHGLRWMLSSKHHVAVPSYAGACGFLGHRVPNDLVFGEPIEPACAKPGEPTDAEVQAAHTAYIAALKTLFDEHKAGLGYGDRELLVA